MQISPQGDFDYTSARERIGKAAKLSTENDYLLRAEFEGLTITLYKDGRALVHGTGDVARARSMYSRLIG
ncbi:MAG: hypothetical protein M5U25_04810 [Planctomycetota bacterium]|nr:hypothetical protein [Planctomycetota bacterium]